MVPLRLLTLLTLDGDGDGCVSSVAAVCWEANVSSGSNSMSEDMESL